jgi:putative hemin transport protein
MKKDALQIREAWLALRALEPGLHGLEVAERIGASECEILASACGSAGPVSPRRIEASWPELIAELPKLGFVKAVTRNPHAVIEVEGTYDKIEFFGAMGQSVSTIDLRIFTSRWKSAFAVDEETKRGRSRSLQFFDGSGRAVHKLFLREASDHAFFETLVREHTSPDQSPAQVVTPPELLPPDPPDDTVDVGALRDDWLAMKDTHEFHVLLRKYKLGRLQAFRLVGEDLAWPVSPARFEELLRGAAGTELPIMIFVGNPGMLQIYSGPIRRVVTLGPWINVIDPGFDLHVRNDRIANAWVVRKPTVDGNVTSLELYDDAGDQIALVVGKRKPGLTENPAWRAAVERL